MDGLWRNLWASNTSSLTYGSQSAAPPGTGCWSGGHPAADIPSPQRPTCVGVSCTYSSETETSPNRIHKPPCLKRGENGWRSPNVDRYTLFLLHKVDWIRLCSAVHQSVIQTGKIFHSAYFYVDCIHHAARSQFLPHAVVTMNLLLVHNNLDLFIPQKRLVQAKDREKVEVPRENKGPSLNDLSVAQLDFITLAALQLSAGPAVTQRANAQQRHPVWCTTTLESCNQPSPFVRLATTMDVLYQWRHKNAHAN